MYQNKVQTNSTSIAMDYPKAISNLVKLHHQIVLLRQHWRGQPWELLDETDRLAFLQNTLQYQASQLPLPAWNGRARVAPSSITFSLLDTAGSQTLLRQATALFSKSQDQRHIAEMTRTLTRRARFRECSGFFEWHGSSIRRGVVTFKNCCSDTAALLKLLATMPPTVAAIVIEKLFIRHESLFYSLTSMVKQMGPDKLAGNTAKIMAERDKIKALWRVAVKNGVVLPANDLDDAPDDLGAFSQKANKLASIANGMQEASTRLSAWLRTNLLDFMAARDWATRTQEPGLSENDASSAALFDMVHEPIRCTAVWSYLNGLLVLLRDRPNDGLLRALAVRELAETCRGEHKRLKAALQRHATVDLGAKLPELAAALDYTGRVRGRARVTAQDLDAMNDQLLAVLADLCRRTTTPARASALLMRWAALRVDKAEEMTRRISQDTGFVLQQLASMVYFTQQCSAVLAMDTAQRFRNQSFTPKLARLQRRLSQAKAGFSLRREHVPDDMLVTEGVARAYVHATQEFTKAATGMSLSDHYERLVAASVAELKQRCANVEAELGSVAVVRPTAPGADGPAATNSGVERSNPPSRKRRNEDTTAQDRDADSAFG